MRWHYVRAMRRHFYGTDHTDWAFVDRNGANPEIFDANVYGRGGAQFETLREAKAWVEKKLARKTTPNESEGGDG